MWHFRHTWKCCRHKSYYYIIITEWDPFPLILVAAGNVSDVVMLFLLLSQYTSRLLCLVVCKMHVCIWMRLFRADQCRTNENWKNGVFVSTWSFCVYAQFLHHIYTSTSSMLAVINEPSDEINTQRTGCKVVLTFTGILYQCSINPELNVTLV